MSTPILATKLYVPPPQPRVVLRPRLVEHLNEGLHRRLTLVSAPADRWAANRELDAVGSGGPRELLLRTDGRVRTAE